jgi:peptidyl-tRNA hydrolase, PTH2 family
MTSKPVKQVIIIRRDLNMRRGKEIAQGAHAAMAWLTLRLRDSLVANKPFNVPGAEVTPPAFTRLSPAEHAWIEGSFRKVVCQAADLRELTTIYEMAKTAGLEAHLITDNGLTEFGGVPTITALAIGPDFDDRLNPVTGELELY